jgi:hypothetical protein
MPCKRINNQSQRSNGKIFEGRLLLIEGPAVLFVPLKLSEASSSSILCFCLEYIEGDRLAD